MTTRMISGLENLTTGNKEDILKMVNKAAPTH